MASIISSANVKLIILDYYDSIIRDIDIYAEKKLEKCNETDMVEIENNTNSEQTDVEVIQSSYATNTNTNDAESDSEIENYGLENYLDSYMEKYNYEVVNQPKSIQSRIKASDYINELRDEMIDELKKAQKNALIYYESIKSNVNIKSISDLQERNERVRELVLTKQSAFIIRIDKKQADFRPAKKSRFKLYLVLIDFYLKSNEQDLLRYIL